QRALLDLRIRRQVLLHPIQELAADFLVGHFATTEAHGHLGLVSFLEEADQVTQLHLIVALFRAGTEFHFLDLNLLLLALRCMRLLVLLEQEFAEIHDAADRRIRCRRDLDEVQISGLSHLQYFVPTDDAYLASFSVDHSQLRRGDLFVAPDALTNGSSDASYLQNSPAAARDLLSKFLGECLDGHHSEILAAS